MWITSHIVAFILGFITCRHLPPPPRPSLIGMRSLMHVPKLKFKGSTAAVIAFAIGIFVIALGAQTAQFQRQQSAQDARDAAQRTRDAAQTACISQWGESLAATLNTRTKASQRLEDAKAAREDARTARDDANDQILLVVYGFRKVPPEGTKKDFADALERFVQAKRALVEVTRELDTVTRATERARARAPYPAPPDLVCPPGD